jgi:hypothetical protein
MYSIYDDREVPESEGNWDHVIPLAACGRNQFCVWTDVNTNSRLGSVVDASIVNDIIVAFALRNAGAKGHHGKLIVPTWKRTEIEGDPYQIKWRQDNPLFWDAKARTYVDGSLIAGKEISSTHKIDFFSCMRFAAKVALGGAYFIYGDLIRTCVDCDEL